jgi:hypothetical protein
LALRHYNIFIKFEGGLTLPNYIKIPWILAIIFNLVSMIWFLLGTTAKFQRSLDLVGTVTLIFCWIPSLLIVYLSINALIKESPPTNFRVLILVIVLLFLAVNLFKAVNTAGWLYDDITSDPIKTTTDGNFEYRTELVNLFQKNSRAQLFLRNVSNGQEVYIPLEVNTNEIHVIGISSTEDWMWAVLSKSNIPDHYELTTTEKLPVPQKRFLINIKKGTARIL